MKDAPVRVGLDGRVLLHPVMTGVERFTTLVFSEISRLAGAENVQVFRPSTHNRYLQHLWAYTTLPRLVREASCNALYCSASAAPFSLDKRIRLVVTIHDISFITNPDLYSFQFREYYKMVLPRIIERADAITTVSQTEQRRIAEHFPASKDKLVISYPGIQEVFRVPQRRMLNRTILVVGSINRHKNIPRLLRAFRSILDRTDHRLVIIGGRRDAISSEPELDAALGGIPSDRISMVGHVADAQLVEAYQSASLFVFPSLWEGFGAVPLEAMACGCPVVASDRAAIPEVCGDAAYYFDPTSETEIAEAMLTVLNDVELQSRLRTAGYVRSRQFSYSQTAGIIFDLLRGSAR